MMTNSLQTPRFGQAADREHYTMVRRTCYAIVNGPGTVADKTAALHKLYSNVRHWTERQIIDLACRCVALNNRSTD
jgi:hypothetical protein